MFQIIFIFSDWILIKQNDSFVHPFCLGRNKFSKTSTWSFEWGTGARVKMHRFNAFSRNVDTINWNFFPTYVRIYKSEKIQQAFWRLNPKKFKEVWKNVSLTLILKDKGGKQHCSPICWFEPGSWDIFEKEGTSEKGYVEIEDWGFSVHFVLKFQENSIYTLHLCFS